MRAELDTPVAERPGQRLAVGVRDHELDALEFGPDHVVDGVAAGAAHAHDGDARPQFVRHAGYPNLQWHLSLPSGPACLGFPRLMVRHLRLPFPGRTAAPPAASFGPFRGLGIYEEAAQKFSRSQPPTRSNRL